MVCKNPLLAEERTRKREALLVATETALKRTQARVEREKNPLRGAAAIGRAVGAVLAKSQVGKHFQIEIGETSLGCRRNETAIAAEAALDGIYVLRTSLAAEQADSAATVRAYKSLAQVERAFRALKRADLELRPVFHWTAPRVRAHVLLCMLAYYLEWHMRRALGPMLFDDHDLAGREAPRSSPVAQAKPSAAARRKAARKQTEPVGNEPLPVHSFHTLMADLATLTRNTVRLGRDRISAILTSPTAVQRRAFELLGVAAQA